MLLDEGPSGFGFGVLVRSLAERPSWFVGLPEEAEWATELGQWSLSQMGQWFVDGRWGAAERGTLHRSGCFKEIVNLSGYRLSDLDLAASDVLVVGENLVVVPGGGRLRSVSDPGSAAAGRGRSEVQARDAAVRALEDLCRVTQLFAPLEAEVLKESQRAAVAPEPVRPPVVWEPEVWTFPLTQVEWRDDLVVVVLEGHRHEVPCGEARAAFEDFKGALQAEDPGLEVVIKGQRSSKGRCRLGSVSVPRAMLERFVLLERRRAALHKHKVGGLESLDRIGEDLGLPRGEARLGAYCAELGWEHSEELTRLWRVRDRTQQVRVFRGQAAVLAIRDGVGRRVWVWEEADYGRATFLFLEVESAEAEAALWELVSSEESVRRALHAGGYEESVGVCRRVKHSNLEDWWAQVRAVLGL
ncbi:MAG: hypothetical protein VX899_07300 [Myxococcota bacterium]|nr:hypothetical protein [Myxococcota bacterium]